MSYFVSFFRTAQHSAPYTTALLILFSMSALCTDVDSCFSPSRTTGDGCGDKFRCDSCEFFLMSASCIGVDSCFSTSQDTCAMVVETSGVDGEPGEEEVVGENLETSSAFVCMVRPSLLS